MLIEQVPFVEDLANGLAGGLDDHHLLGNLLFATSSEVVQLEEAVQRRHLRTFATLPGGPPGRVRGIGTGAPAVDLPCMSHLFLVLGRRRVGGDGPRTRIA